jgi:hypothetical protein
MRLALVGAGRHGQRYLKPENGGEAITTVCRSAYETSALNPMKEEAAIVAVQTGSHYHVAISLLEHGLHVLLEKPAALRFAEVEDLLTTAEAYERVLMVAHTHCFAENFPTGLTRADVAIGGPRPDRDMRGVSPIADWGSHAVAMLFTATGQLGNPLGDWTIKPSSVEGGYSAEFEFGRVKVGDWAEKGVIAGSKGNRYMGPEQGAETPMKRMVDVFLRACRGEPDFRASSEFTRAVYKCVLA